MNAPITAHSALEFIGSHFRDPRFDLIVYQLVNEKNPHYPLYAVRTLVLNKEVLLEPIATIETRLGFNEIFVSHMAEESGALIREALGHPLHERLGGSWVYIVNTTPPTLYRESDHTVVQFAVPNAQSELELRWKHYSQEAKVDGDSE